MRISAIAAVSAIVMLSGCVTSQPPPPIMPVPRPENAMRTHAHHAITANEPGFLKLSNLPAGHVPVRIGVLLPFSNGSPATRQLAQSMLKAAELAMYDAHNPDIVLMSADEGGTPEQAASGARKLLQEGAEVIVGPLFAHSVSAVAPIARDHAVPVIAFSTDRTVAGDGVYLLSFQPGDEVRRVVGYAVTHGRHRLAALVPKTAYGERVAKDFRENARADGLPGVTVETFNPAPGGIAEPARKVVAGKPDAVMIAAGGDVLRGSADELAADGIDNKHIRMLGTGLWYDPSLNAQPALQGAWFAAPEPDSDSAFEGKFQNVFGSSAPPLSTLAYDAVSLVALLSDGTPYRRFTDAALTDPNGFAGITGIFRFNPDGSSDRGLAILEVSPGGFRVIDPAPTTFQRQGS